MIKSSFFLFIYVSLHAGLLFNQETQNTEWELSKNKDQISIYLRTVHYSKYKEFKGEMIVASSPEIIVSFLKHIDSFKQWLPDCIESKKLIQLSSHEQINYVLTDVPWPYEDRDISYQFTVMEKDPKSGEIKITIENKSGYVPVKKNVVRIPRSVGFWTICSISENQTKVAYQMHVEPGGYVPAWLTNLKIVDTPFTFLSNLRSQIENL